MFNIRFWYIAGGARSTGDGLIVVWDVGFVIDQIRIFPLYDVGFWVPLWLFPYRHVISIWWDIIWIIEGYVLTALLLFLLLLLGLLLLGLLWHFGLVAVLAVVAQDQAEHHQGKDSGTAADNSRHCPDREDHLLCCGAWAADKTTIVGRLTDGSLWTLDAQTGHKGLAGLACVELSADAGEA